MENQIMYLKKTKAEIIAEKLLKEKQDFQTILHETGWDTMMQIFDYIDSKFRNQYPKEYNNDIEYYCMGIQKKKEKTYSKTR